MLGSNAGSRWVTQGSSPGPGGGPTLWDGLPSLHHLLVPDSPPRALCTPPRGSRLAACLLRGERGPRWSELGRAEASVVTRFHQPR